NTSSSTVCRAGRRSWPGCSKTGYLWIKQNSTQSYKEAKAQRGKFCAFAKDVLLSCNSINGRAGVPMIAVASQVIAPQAINVNIEDSHSKPLFVLAELDIVATGLFWSLSRIKPRCKIKPLFSSCPQVQEIMMSKYVPSPQKWVADQVEQYESSGGIEGITLRDNGLPVIIVTNRGRKTGAIRKTPLMRVVDGKNYILVASQGGAPKHPLWYYNLKVNPNVEIRDKGEVYAMRVREVVDPDERQRLWAIAVKAYPPYEAY